MSTDSFSSPTALDVLRRQAHLVDRVVRLNLEDLTHEESLAAPSRAGNCFNWVLGHLLSTYEDVLPLLGQKPVTAEGDLDRYARGEPALEDGTEALDLERLEELWSAVAARIDEGLSELPPEHLDRPAPFSPGNDPEETLGSLLTVVLFHQSYHAGQTGLLRRVAGKPGAIA